MPSNKLNVFEQNTQTMTSLEIATLTGKQHKNVMRDITKLLKELGLDVLKFEHIYFDSMNRKRNQFKLPRRECDLLIMGYSVQARANVYDRWQELENAQPKLSLADQLINAGKALKAKELELQKSEAERARIRKEFIDAMAVEGLRDFKATADRIGIKGFGRNTMLKCLRDKQWLNKDNKPYRLQIENERFAIRTMTHRYTNGDVYSRDIPLVTERGVVDILLIAQEWLRNQEPKPQLAPPPPPAQLVITHPITEREKWVGWTDQAIVDAGHGYWK